MNTTAVRQDNVFCVWSQLGILSAPSSRTIHYDDHRSHIYFVKLLTLVFKFRFIWFIWNSCIAYRPICSSFFVPH